MNGALDPALALVLRVALVLLLAGATSHKLRAPGAFRAALARYELVPMGMVPVVTAAIVASETACLGALLVRPALGGAAVATLLLAYAAAMAVALARGHGGIDCGCGGPGGAQPLRRALVVRNVALAAAALGLCAPVAARGLGWMDGVTIAGATAAASLLLGAANTLLATWPRTRALRAAAEGA